MIREFADPTITLAREELGWQPDVRPADGLRRTIAWFAETLRSNIPDGRAAAS